MWWSTGPTVAALLSLGLAGVAATDHACAKGESKTTITIENGDTFEFKTQTGKKYKKNTDCTVEYLLGNTCEKIKLDCSKKKFFLKGSKKCGENGDKFTVTTDKETSYCGKQKKKNRPKVTHKGNITVNFISDKKKHSTGAICNISCNKAATGTGGGETGESEIGSSVSYTPYTGDFTEKILTVEQSWAQEPTGYNRTATAYLPDTPAMSGKLPVVIDLHGFGGKGTKRWKDIGDQIIFVGADGYCPPGEKCSWNVFGEPSKAPDTEFILELISKIGDEIPDADMDNVNIVGTSNGAALTYLLLLSTNSSRPFRRAIPMSSSLINVQYNNNMFWKFSSPAASGEYNNYDTTISQFFAGNFEFVHFHGTEDSVINYEGGYSAVVGTDALSAQETDLAWAKELGYTGAAWVEEDGLELGGSTADNQIIEYTFLGGQVRHYKMVGAGHVSEPNNNLAKQILLDIITATQPTLVDHSGVPQRDWDYLDEEDPTTPGPVLDTVYLPGTRGAAWTDHEIAATRRRIFQMIHPNWEVMKKQGTWVGFGTATEKGQVTENSLVRLAFHDCLRYEDSTYSRPCDGCLNWEGMNVLGPMPNNREDDYKYDPLDKADNRNMDNLVEKLELIYTTVDWPFVNASLGASLYQTGKSRADLWQLAALVALERTMERANRACDLDYGSRQQNTMLESREACEMKLTKPMKFYTGRVDCISDDPQGRPYVTTHHEIHNKMFEEANPIIDYGKSEFNLDPAPWLALMAIHGAVHFPNNLGVKYTWFGPGYLSNVYWKMVANDRHPLYTFDNMGDLAFGDPSGGALLVPTAVGTPEGEPLHWLGWRASCSAGWNTTEGGPCVLRPTKPKHPDSPNPGMAAQRCCLKFVDNQCTETSPNQKCTNVSFNNRIEIGARTQSLQQTFDTPWDPTDMNCDGAGFGGVGKCESTAATKRHTAAWNNAFAFPWEVGMYHNLSVGGVGQRPTGCPGMNYPELPAQYHEGINLPFGTVTNPNWPFRVDSSPIFMSPAMNCTKNTYVPPFGEGKPVWQVVDELAADNEYWAENFMQGWQDMVTNRYTEEELEDGPQSAWLGHYSLTEQGIDVGDFETYIQQNKPVVFTDPTADPYICAHRGHGGVSCGWKFSDVWNAENQRAPGGVGHEGPGF